MFFRQRTVKKTAVFEIFYKIKNVFSLLCYTNFMVRNFFVSKNRFKSTVCLLSFFFNIVFSICQHCRLLLKNFDLPFYVHVFIFLTFIILFFLPASPGWWIFRYDIIGPFRGFEETPARRFWWKADEPFVDTYHFDQTLRGMLIIIHAPSGERMFHQ